jgi:hypothetical protein
MPLNDERFDDLDLREEPERSHTGTAPWTATMCSTNCTPGCTG